MREKISINADWSFHRGDIIKDFPRRKLAAYDSAKTERALFTPAAQNYNIGAYTDEIWTKVDLPHDYVIDQIPDKKYNEALGFFKYENAWYVKKIHLEESDKNKRLSILFEGVATHATVWVNGCLMKHNFSGYTSFEVDITDVAKFGEENTIAVYVNTQSHEGWWYEGGGIYRNVWLLKSAMISVDLWGVYAKPVYKGDGAWTVETEATIRNDYDKKKNVRIVAEILDAEGNVIATTEKGGTVADKDKKTFNYRFTVENPDLWSPEEPNQHIMRTKVYNGKQVLDIHEVKFGFRTLRIDPKSGLYINEKHYKIQGVCGHADCGLMGKAVPDNIHRYKVRLMKEMGANGYRTTHYPQAEALMDALDEAGFIVMNEVRWFESTDEGKAQLEMLMKRDRNRPGVVFWSVGNEEPHHTTETGRRIAKSLMSFARRLDDSRFITSAVWHAPEQATVYDELEIVGINYNWKAYNSVHEKYPEKAVVSSENGACGTTRGWYFDDDPEKSLVTAYDHDISLDWRCREYTWKFIAEREWMIGGYQWIAFEHRGEAVWPRLCSQSGAIDLFMQKKDAFYQNVSHWTREPMVHLLPHWNFRGLEGENIRVVAYTNTPRVELFLNGESLGIRDIEPYGHGEWMVPYTPGKLEVVAYDGEKVVARDVRITSGAPKKLMLTLDSGIPEANGNDIAIISCYTVDEDGNEVYDATPEVFFAANSLGRVYSTGSDITECDTIFKSTRKMRAGRIGVAVKVGKQAGELKVYAHSEGLESAVLTIPLK